jgi:hypothetical protein
MKVFDIDDLMLDKGEIEFTPEAAIIVEQVCNAVENSRLAVYKAGMAKGYALGVRDAKNEMD